VRTIALRPALHASALTLSLVLLWSLTHRYRGLAGDAELYAFQALARSNAALANDLYLQDVSQDRYTIFPVFYDWCIGLMGLPTAALVLSVLCKIGLFTAAWSLARKFSTPKAAFFSVTLLIVTVGGYGANGVFHYLEDYLTARSVAETLVVSSIAFHFHGWRIFGLLLAILAIFVHPLMGLPGLLLLMCLWTSPKVGIAGAAVGILAALVVALAAGMISAVAHIFPLMDKDWLNVVLERSQFLFLQYWSAEDWGNAARPLLSLTLSALVLDDPRVRRLCLAAMLVGGSGLAVALIPSLFKPVAILLQGQAWRWIWVASLTGLLLLSPTVIRAWKDDTSGPLSAILMLAAWAVAGLHGALCAALALLLWLARGRVSLGAARQVRSVAKAGGVAILAWIVASSWTKIVSRPPDASNQSIATMILRNLMVLGPVSALVGVSLAYVIRLMKSVGTMAVCCMILLAASVFTWQETFIRRVKEIAEPAEFLEWRRAIPAHSNVFVVPSSTSAGFAWFTLERPNYLSLNQSAGVVFSRQTALEVRRRAEMVLPVWDRTWQIRTRKKTPSGGSPAAATIRPLTKEKLVAICGDQALDFVVARESVGFYPLIHSQEGNWKNWNLYDCRRVNAGVPGA
jgi:hypothetical protein